MDRIAGFLRGKRLLVTGATGFLGQPLLEKILWTAPDVDRIYVLIRPKRPFGGEMLNPQERLEREIFPSSVFDRLRDRHGDDFDSFLAEKVIAVAGDISRENLGFDPAERSDLARTLDVIVNSAAVVSFDAPLDQAFELNTLGSGRVAAFAAECDHAMLIHVSTAYVCGATNATIPETIHHQAPPGTLEPYPARQFTDFQLDLDHIRGLIDHVHEEGRSTEVRRELIEALVRRSRGKKSQRTEPRRQIVENLRKKWIEHRLVDVGMTWARQRGWNDTYTYTKALGEQMVLRNRAMVPTVILRPAIIESSLLEPSPGWLDGLRMADPLIAAIGKGRLRSLPLDPQVTLDIVPADMVVNALLASIPKIAEDGGLAVYQVATGSRNPVRMHELHELIVGYFQANPMLDKEGRPIEVKPLKFPSAERFRREYKLKALPLEATEKILEQLIERGVASSRAQKFKRQAAANRAAIDKLFYYGELYLPYLNLDCRFDVSRMMELHTWLEDEERRRYNFDVTRLNWRHYIQVHIAGVKKYILKAERSGTLELDDEAAAEREGVATIVDILEHAVQRYPDLMALQIRHEGELRGYTFRELREAARSVAGRLKALGLAKGDRVVLWSENRPEWGAAYFGASTLGLVVVPLDAQTWPREVWSTARFTGTRAILASRACFQRVPPEQIEANEGAARPLSVLEVDVECRPLAIEDFPRTTAAGAAAAGAPPLPDRDVVAVAPDDPASIIFTTSTAVDPKGAVHTHRNFLNNLFGVSRYLGPREGDRFLSVLPLYHALEFTCGFLAPIYRGASVTYARSLKPKVIIETMRETGTSIMLGVPTLYALIRDDIERRILRDEPRRPRIVETTRQIARRLKSDLVARQIAARVREELGGRIRVFVSGGSALGEDLYLAYRELGLTLYEGYGLTETAPVLTVNPLHRSRAGSAGKPLPGIELRLYHTNSEGIGEIIVRSPSLMTGYYKNPRATKRAIVDGWFHTGDLGWVDTDGYLYITGRIKDVIVTGAGKNVYPMDLEAIYRELVLGIREIAVVGVPSGLTEDVHAVVVPDRDVLGELPEEEVRKTIQRRIQAVGRELPSYHRLQQVHLWDALPRDKEDRLDREAIRKRVGERAPAGELRPTRPSTDAGRDREAVLLRELSRLARVPEEEIGRGTHLYDDLGLDSLLAIELLLFLEHEFGVSLEDEVAARLETVGDLLAEIEARLSEPDPASGGGPAPSRRAAIRSALPHDERRAVHRWLFGAFRTGAKTLYRAWFDLEVEHPERLPREAPYLIAANHASHLDAPAVLSAVEFARGRRAARKLHVLGARDYFFDTRLKGWFFSTFLNAVPIEREETSLSGLRTVKSILASGEAALIFPEGTRSRSGEIQPFKAGLGLLAWELQVPIVPVHIEGTHEALPVGKHVPRKNRVRVTFGEPVTMDQYRELAKAVPPDELYRRIAADVRRRIVALGDGVHPAGRGAALSRPETDGTG
ncbi:MAG: AMP-binding protein [Gemmatimonadota bacterium]